MRSVSLVCSLLLMVSSFSSVAEEVSPVVVNEQVTDAVTETTAEQAEVDGEAVSETPSATVSEVAVPVLFQARIEQHSAEELHALLTRAESIAAGQDEYTTTEPIAVVLSGEEIELFKREKYRDHKSLVDFAARLDAFNIIEVKSCSTWMSQRGIESTDLPPFVENVPSAHQENIRLEKAGYAYF